MEIPEVRTPPVAGGLHARIARTLVGVIRTVGAGRVAPMADQPRAAAGRRRTGARPVRAARAAARRRAPPPAADRAPGAPSGRTGIPVRRRRGPHHRGEPHHHGEPHHRGGPHHRRERHRDRGAHDDDPNSAPPDAGPHAASRMRRGRATTAAARPPRHRTPAPTGHRAGPPRPACSPRAPAHAAPARTAASQTGSGLGGGQRGVERKARACAAFYASPSQGTGSPIPRSARTPRGGRNRPAPLRSVPR